MVKQNYHQAHKIIVALIQGVDPTTQQPLSSSDSVLNKVEVTRALATASVALEHCSERAARRALLPDAVGKPWTDEEEQQLKEKFQSGEPDIADKHKRTIRAIEARLERFGLITAEQRTTRNSMTRSSDAGRRKK